MDKCKSRNIHVHSGQEEFDPYSVSDEQPTVMTLAR